MERTGRRREGLSPDGDQAMNERMCACGCGRKTRDFKATTGAPCEYLAGHCGRSLAQYIGVQKKCAKERGMSIAEYMEMFYKIFQECNRAPACRVAERHCIPMSTFYKKWKNWRKWVERHGERFWETTTLDQGAAQKKKV